MLVAPFIIILMTFNDSNPKVVAVSVAHPTVEHAQSIKNMFDPSIGGIAYQTLEIIGNNSVILMRE